MTAVARGKTLRPASQKLRGLHRVSVRPIRPVNILVLPLRQARRAVSLHRHDGHPHTETPAPSMNRRHPPTHPLNPRPNLSSPRHVSHRPPKRT